MWHILHIVVDTEGVFYLHNSFKLYLVHHIQLVTIQQKQWNELLSVADSHIQTAGFVFNYYQSQQSRIL